MRKYTIEINTILSGGIDLDFKLNIMSWKTVFLEKNIPSTNYIAIP